MNVTDPPRRRALTEPDATAIIRADHTKISFRRLDQLVDFAARQLRGLGLRAGQVAGLAITGPDEFLGLVVSFGLARLGVASADPALPAEHMDLFIAEGGRSAKPGVRTVPIEAIWAGMAGDQDTAPVPSHPDGGAIYRIFASSGTTGTPKFSAVSHARMNDRVLSNWREVGGDQSVHICAVGMGVEYGATHVLRTLWSGGALVLTNPDAAVASMHRHGVTSMVCSAITLQRIVAGMAEDAPAPASLGAIEVGGSPLPAPLRALARTRLCRMLRSHYGSTETGAVASAPFAILEDASGAVGHVHAGVEMEAVAADHTPLPPGAEGILRIRSPNAVTGYLGDPAISATVFRDGWFYCGDIGSVGSDGRLTVSGRTGDFINSGGNKVAARVIEDVLLAYPRVTEAAAFGVPDRLGVTQIWAAIVADSRIETKALSAVCRQRLNDKAPKYVLQLRGLPRNANGKLLREELARFAASRQP